MSQQPPQQQAHISLSEKYQHLFAKKNTTTTTNNNNTTTINSTTIPSSINVQKTNLSSTNTSSITSLYSSRPSTSTSSFIRGNGIKEPIAMSSISSIPTTSTRNSLIAGASSTAWSSTLPSTTMKENSHHNISASTLSLLNNYKMSLGGFKRELSPSSVKKNLDVPSSSIMENDDHQIHDLTSSNNNPQQQFDYLPRSSLYQKPSGSIKPITWKPLSEQERSAIASNLLSNSSNSLNNSSGTITSSNNNKSIFDSSDEEEEESAELIASRKRMKMNHTAKSLQQSNDNSFTTAPNNPMNISTSLNTIGLSNTLNSRPSIIKSDITNNILSNPLTLADRFKRLNEKQPTIAQKNDSKSSLLVTKSLFSNNSLNSNLNNSIVYLNKDNTSPIKPIRESIYVNNNEPKLSSTFNNITTTSSNSINNNINMMDDNISEDMSFTRLNSTIMTSTNTNNNTNTTNLSIPNINSSILSTFSHNNNNSKQPIIKTNNSKVSTLNNTNSSLNSSLSNITATINTNNSITSGKQFQQIRKNKEELITYQTLFYQIHYIVAMVLESFEKQEEKIEQELYNGWCFIQERKKILHDRRDALFKKQSTLKLHELLNYDLNINNINQLLTNIDLYFRNYHEIQNELKQTLNCIAIADDIEVSSPEMNISNRIESGIELAFSLEKSFKILQQIINEMNQILNDTSNLKVEFTSMDDIIHQSTCELNRLSHQNIPYLSNIESEHTSLLFQSVQSSLHQSVVSTTIVQKSSDPFSFNLLRESLGL